MIRLAIIHPGGGWVATHEDVTEQQILNARLKQQNALMQEQEHQLRLQNIHLDAALNNMSQGLILCSTSSAAW